MANPQQQENMLLTEHFSWPPISLIDDIINTVNEVLYRCTDTFESGISNAPPHLLGFADRYTAEKRSPEKDEDGNDVYPDAALEIEEGVLKLETLMENAVDKNFDKLEIWTLRNVLCLPRGEEELARWVRLGHYEGVDGDAVRRDSEGGKWTPERLYALRRKLVETQKLHAALLAERTRNDALLAQLKGMLSPPTEGVKRESAETESSPSQANAGALAFLTHTPAAQSLGLTSTPNNANPSTANATPLATHTSFTATQLPYLRNLLSTLRPHLSSTALPTSTSHSDGDSADRERERKTYLESQSKRILERRGVDTTEGVEGWVGGNEGRVRGEEVRGLEGIAEALGNRVPVNGSAPATSGGGEDMDIS